MIDIIKHGNIPIGPITYRFTCRHCGCIYDVDDYDMGVRYHIGGIGHPYVDCDCPDCGYTNSIDTGSVTNET